MVEVQKIAIAKRITAIVGLLGLAACSHSNVSGEWECPRPTGHGCINIAVADKMAIEKLRASARTESASSDTEADSEAGDKDNKDSTNASAGSSGIFRKIWFSPYTDNAGNWHDSSVVYYQE